MSHSFVKEELNKSVEESGVRVADIRLKMRGFDSDTGEFTENFVDMSGYHVKEGGEDVVFAYNHYEDSNQYGELNLSNKGVTVRLGDFINRGEYDYSLEGGRTSGDIRKVINGPTGIAKEMPKEYLVIDGAEPSALHVEMQSRLNNLSKEYGTPDTVRLPKGESKAMVLDAVNEELDKLENALAKQALFAKEHGIVPEYKGRVLDLQSESYSEFKTAIVKNCSLAKSGGLMFNLEKRDDGISISINDVNGKSVASLSSSSFNETSFIEQSLSIGESVEMSVLEIPDVSSMSSEGNVSDGLRSLVSHVRENYSLIVPSTPPSDLVSVSDINDAVRYASQDVASTGRTAIRFGEGDASVASSKLTSSLSRQLSDLANELMTPSLEKSKETEELSIGM